MMLSFVAIAICEERRQLAVEMHYDRKRLFIALGGGFGALAAILVALYMGGVALAVPLGGIGGFRIQADRVELQGFSLTPRIGDNSQREVSPAVRNQARTAIIEGLVVSKRIPIPEGVPGAGGRVFVITITGSEDQPVEIQGLIQDAMYLQARSFQAEALEQDEAPPSLRQGWEQSFYQLSPRVVIIGLDSQNNYQFANSITIPGLQVNARLE